MGKTDSEMQGGSAMKAYAITVDSSDLTAIVFAETRNKAKSIAQYTETFGYVEYIDVRAKRIPALDKYYKGKSEMDWYNMRDRVAMVKEAGFTCSYEFETEDCEKCSARQWCDRCEVES